MFGYASLVVGMLLVGLIYVDLARPSLVDRFNTTGQLLKHHHLPLYLDLQKEKSELMKRIGQLTRMNPTPYEIESALIDFRRSVDFKSNQNYKDAMRTLTKEDLQKFYESLW